MQIKDMPPEERRKYNAEAQQRSRDRTKAKALASVIPKANKFQLPELQREKLAVHAAQIVTTIQAELTQELSEQDRFVMESIADVNFGLENNFTQVVHDPEGILIGGHFPDAVASEAIEHVHRIPQLLESITFSDLYRKFVSAVSKWVKKNPTHVSPEFARDISRELAGEYRLPEPKFVSIPVPLPEPEPFPAVDNTGRKTIEQLNGDFSQFYHTEKLNKSRS